MKRKRFTEEQIIGILKEAEAGAKSIDLCRRHAISEQTFYRWSIRSKDTTGSLLHPCSERHKSRPRRRLHRSSQRRARVELPYPKFPRKSS
jgi:hypothetical protein